MSPDVPNSFAALIATRFRRMFRPGDAATVTIVGIALGAFLVGGQWLAAQVTQAQPARPSLAALAARLAIGIGMAVVLAALQVDEKGVTLGGALRAWFVFAVVIAVALLSGASATGDAVVLATGTLGASLWLYLRRS